MFVKNKNAFTMIELLMVIILIGVLTAVAVPRFLDFRNEGRKSSLLVNLNAYRLGIRFAITQAKVRCSSNNYPVSAYGIPSGMLNALYYTNDLTSFASDPANIICTQAQIPVYQDRLILGKTETVVIQQGGVPIQTKQGLINPFADYTAPNVSMIHNNLQTNIDAQGGRCAFVNYVRTTGGNLSAHWIFLTDTGDFFPGTNVLGECAL